MNPGETEVSDAVDVRLRCGAAEAMAAVLAALHDPGHPVDSPQIARTDREERMTLRLRVVSADGRRFEHEVDGDELVVGRSSRAGLALADRAMSREHARFQPGRGRLDASRTSARTTARA